MASQDNPERGLCRNPLADSPIQLNKHVKGPTRRSISGSKKIHISGGETLKRNTSATDTERFKSDQLRTSSSAAPIDSKSSRNDEASDKDNLVETRKSKAAILEEYTTIDHKSFIQNMFGTVAFKMVEWLTPRNLEALTKPVDKVADSTARCSPLAQSTPSDGANTPAQKPEGSSGVETDLLSDNTSFLPTPSPEVPADVSDVLDRWDRNEGSTDNDITNTNTQKETSSDLPPAIPFDTKPVNLPSPEILHDETAHVASSKSRRRTDSYDAHVSRGVLNLPSPPRATDTDSSSLLPRQSIRSKSKPAPHPIITRPVLHLPETNTSSPTTSQTSATDQPMKFAEPGLHLESDLEVNNSTQNLLIEIDKPETPLCDEKPPQSLSSLPIEVINLICDILENDNTCEKHQLHPDHIDDDLKRHQVYKIPLRRNLNLITGYPKSMKKQWRRFIDQSLYSVLSRPDTLIKSFTGQDGQVFDTQTLWYCMLRMTRVAPSVVFDSLWIAAGTLFKPPKQLEWAKQYHGDSSISDQSVPKVDAARIINICFHALVAAAPLLTDPRQLANMSRIRSYGLVLPGIESSTSESAALCLQYNDAFTDELVLRLARRVFSAVSTRRRFSELIQLQQDVKGDEKEQDGVLEIILGTFKYLDLDTPPLLNFTAVERDLHEKRIPTLLLDWARTVMLQDWDGRAEVPSDGPFGGALETIAAICMTNSLIYV